MRKKLLREINEAKRKTENALLVKNMAISVLSTLVIALCDVVHFQNVTQQIVVVIGWCISCIGILYAYDNRTIISEFKKVLITAKWTIREDKRKSAETHYQSETALDN